MTSKLRIFFPGFDPGQRPVPLAYACGLGENPHGGYVFTRRGSLQELSKNVRLSFDRAQCIADADLVVYPHIYVESAATNNVEKLAQDNGLPCVFFRNSDRPPPAKLRYGIVLQEAIYASRQTPCEYPHPAVIDDLAVGRELVPRRRRDRPIVGFIGNRGRGTAADAFWRLIHWREYSGSRLRQRAIRQCHHDPLLECQFDFAVFGRAKQSRDALRERYIRNILDSDYVLAIRGAGNWSYRFYETLSLGRIPVFLNTDCSLPASDVIDWKRHCVWIEPSGFGRVPALIREFHHSLSESEFQNLQRENRAIWKNYLAPASFWQRTLGDLVRQKIQVER